MPVNEPIRQTWSGTHWNWKLSMYSAFHPTEAAQFLIKWKQLLITTCWDCVPWAAVFLSFQSHSATGFPSSTQQSNGLPLIRYIHKESESKLNINL